MRPSSPPAIVAAPGPYTITPDDVLDVDLPCAHCRYNLRGLAGKPVRCPECFSLNERSSPWIADDAVHVESALRKHPWLRQHTIAAAVAAALALLALFSSPLLGHGSFGCALQLIPFTAAMWIGEFVYIRSRCRNAPDWFAAFLTHQFYAITHALLIAVIWLGAVCMAALLAPASDRRALFPSLIVFLVPAILTRFNPVSFLNRRAKAALRPITDQLWPHATPIEVNSESHGTA